MTNITYYCMFIYIDLYSLRGEHLGEDIKCYRIGELAQLAGVSARTIDYYTQIGILKEKYRTSGNHRLYSEDALVSIRIVKQLQEQHFSLDEIGQLLKSKDKNDLIAIMVGIQELLNNLQKKVVELYSHQREKSQPEENKVASRELIANGLSVIQTLMLLLGQYVN